MPLFRSGLPTRHERSTERLPPGQKKVKGLPVLHEGPVPTFDPSTWRLKIFGSVERELDLDWEAFCALAQQEVQADFHCVTSWSRFDNRWAGVPVQAILDLARPLPEVRWVMAHAWDDFGYTTNLALRDFAREGNLLATHLDGAPLEPAHGGPMRLVVHHLYAWKSCKWLGALEFRNHDRRGYWERNGYHNHADPWLEERYSYQESES